MAGLVELEIEYQRLVAERDALGARFEAGETNLLPEIKSINSKIRIVLMQIESLQAVTSSGTVIAEEQQAQARSVVVQSPAPELEVLENGRIKPRSQTTSGTNALDPVGPTSVDSGLNQPTRTIATTQSTAPGSGQTSPGPVREDSVTGGRSGNLSVGGNIGVGAASDDRGTTTNATVAEVNAIDYGNKIIPQGNILDQYASYTYQASLYLVNKDQYQMMINTKQKNINGAQLLVQSGGASAGVGRNNFFSLDYYIDSIDLTSHIVGKGTGLAHNVSDVRMTVVEPNGITFIKNLDSAVQQFLGGSQQKKKNFTSQIYLLVIRFYGYDAQGNLVRGGVNKPDQTSDPNAFVEKWYPLVLSNVKFKIASKAVEYQIEATAVPYYIGASGARGTIPYNIELSGQTLKDLLGGPATYSAGQAAVTAGSNSNPAGKPSPFATIGKGAAIGYRLNLGKKNTNQTSVATQASVRAVDNAIAAAASVASSPPKADAANTARKTVRSGLMAALNEYQQQLKNEKIIEVADQYEIEFALDSLASAKVTNPGLNIGATSMSKPGTAADQKLGAKQSMDPNSRVSGATAGMQIIQFLDNLIRTSSYIKEQQLITINEATGKETPSNINVKNTSWYKISFEAVPLEWDNKRNDYAYKIKYIVSPYKISQLNTPYFKPPLYNGSHKQYTYWFTGQNDSVLSYEENLNSLYYQVLSGTNMNNITSNAIDLLKFQYQTRSGQTDMGAEGRVNEPGANAADQLYSPADLGECNLTIVGDPAWLQQGEAWAGLKKSDPLYYQPFLADGTINFDSQQILFEIGYNLPADYDLATGLIEVAQTPLNSVDQQDQVLRRQGNTQTNKVYIATNVRSHLSKGKFTQDVKGSLLVYRPAKTVEEEQQRIAANIGATTTTTAPKVEYPRSSVTNPAPSSSTAKGQEALLRPTFNGNLTDNQLMSTPVYTQARREGKSGAEALAIARAASQNGTNDYRGSILPGFRDTANTQLVVKDR